MKGVADEAHHGRTLALRHEVAHHLGIAHHHVVHGVVGAREVRHDLIGTGAAPHTFDEAHELLRCIGRGACLLTRNLSRLPLRFHEEGERWILFVIVGLYQRQLILEALHLAAAVFLHLAHALFVLPLRDVSRRLIP